MNENVDDEEDIHKKTESILLQIQKEMELSEQALNAKYNRNNKDQSQSNENKIKQNIVKIEDSNLEFVELDSNFSKKPKDSPFNDICSICSSKIYYDKFICVVCKDCVLCQKCEIDHEHPVIKCKFMQLSTLQDIFSYITNHNEIIKNINQKNNAINATLFSNIFSTITNKYELKLECNSLEFSLRPNTKINIPISIQNLSREPIDCQQNKLILFGRNNKDLKIYNINLNGIINRQEQIDTFITIESNEICKKYNFTVELYSSVNDLIKTNVLNFVLVVNIDDEEDELDKYFKDYPKVLIAPKNIKIGVKKILENPINKKYNPVVLMRFLINNDGNVRETLINLNNLENNGEFNFK